MKIKYLAIAFVVFFLLVGAVSALENIDYFNKAETVSLGGFDFTIPAGYGPVPGESVHTNNGGVKKDGGIFVNDEEDLLAVYVFSGNINLKPEDFVSNEMVSDKQTINGHEGILFHELGYYHKYFAYEDSGSLVLVQANSVSEMESMIPK